MKKLLSALFLFCAITNLPAQVDNTFNSGGSGANATINCVALQSTGKIIIAGSFVQFNTSAKNRIVRLNTNGSIDNTFAIGSGANNVIYSVAIQSDGKILVGGLFTTFNGVAKNRIVRLTTTGAIDNTFSTGSGASDAVRAIVVQTDGKIILGGSFAQFNGVAKGKIVRLSSTGAIDNTFNSSGAGANASSAIFTLALQTDGKILVGGSFTQFNTSAKGRILRLTTSGAIDTGFNSGGSGASSDVKTIKVQGDGKILVGGSFTQFNTSAKGRILRLTTSGAIDTGFNSGGSGANDVVNTIALQSNGKIILGGNFVQFNTSAKTRIVRLSTTGAIDNTLSAGSGATSAINGIVWQTNGGLIVVGAFTQFATSAVGRICRLTNSAQRLSSDENEHTLTNEVHTLTNEVQVFPNPFAEKFEIKIPSVGTSSYNILIYQSNGALIKEINANSFGMNDNKILIDLSSYPSGFYFVNINNESSFYSKKIIKL